jgi:hypothetical protein
MINTKNTKLAKLFRRSQAIPNSWYDFFKLLDQSDLPYDFMKKRQDTKPQKRKLF